MPEVPEEQWTPPKPDCRWRMNNAFMYECRTCGATQKEIDTGKKRCPNKTLSQEEIADFGGV